MRLTRDSTTNGMAAIVNSQIVHPFFPRVFGWWSNDLLIAGWKATAVSACQNMKVTGQVSFDPNLSFTLFALITDSHSTHVSRILLRSAGGFQGTMLVVHRGRIRIHNIQLEKCSDIDVLTIPGFKGTYEVYTDKARCWLPTYVLSNLRVMLLINFQLNNKWGPVEWKE